jgi:hypothetical protein
VVGTAAIRVGSWESGARRGELGVGNLDLDRGVRDSNPDS